MNPYKELSDLFEQHREDFVNSGRIGPLYWKVRALLERIIEEKDKGDNKDVTKT